MFSGHPLLGRHTLLCTKEILGLLAHFWNPITYPKLGFNYAVLNLAFSSYVYHFANFFTLMLYDRKKVWGRMEMTIQEYVNLGFTLINKSLILHCLHVAVTCNVLIIFTFIVIGFWWWWRWKQPHSNYFQPGRENKS